MKNKKKVKFNNLKRFFLLIILPFILYNCNDDDNEIIPIEKTQKTIKGVYLTLEQLKEKNKEISSTIENIDDIESNQNLLKKKNNNQSSSFILTNNILEITNKDYKSYTIALIKKNANKNELYNLLVTQYSNGKTTQFIIKYPISKNGSIDKENPEIKTLNQKNFLFRGGCAPYFESINLTASTGCISLPCKGGDSHRIGYNESLCDVLNDPELQPRLICNVISVNTIRSDCESSGGTTSDGGSTPTDSGTSSGSGGNSGGGTNNDSSSDTDDSTDSDNGDTVDNNSDTITTPVSLGEDLLFYILLEDLSHEQKDFINDSKNLALKEGLNELAKEHNYDSSIFNFISEVIDVIR